MILINRFNQCLIKDSLRIKQPNILPVEFFWWRQSSASPWMLAIGNKENLRFCALVPSVQLGDDQGAGNGKCRWKYKFPIHEGAEREILKSTETTSEDLVWLWWHQPSSAGQATSLPGTKTDQADQRLCSVLGCLVNSAKELRDRRDCCHTLQ